MGIDYQMMFNSKDASRCYKESLKLDPRNPQVLNNLGTVYASTQGLWPADRLYRKALKIDPDRRSFSRIWAPTCWPNINTTRVGQPTSGPWPSIRTSFPITTPHLFRIRLHVAGTWRDELLHGGGLRPRRLCRLRLQYLRMALDEGFTTRKKVQPTASSPACTITPPSNSFSLNSTTSASSCVPLHTSIC